jgi:hypothetical protein
MTTHTLPAGPTAPVSRRPSRAFDNPALLIAVELYLAVAIAEAVFIARALPNLPDIGSFYAFVP